MVRLDGRACCSASPILLSLLSIFRNDVHSPIMMRRKLLLFRWRDEGN